MSTIIPTPYSRPCPVLQSTETVYQRLKRDFGDFGEVAERLAMYPVVFTGSLISHYATHPTGSTEGYEEECYIDIYYYGGDDLHWREMIRQMLLTLTGRDIPPITVNTVSEHVWEFYVPDSDGITACYRLSNWNGTEKASTVGAINTVEEMLAQYDMTHLQYGLVPLQNGDLPVEAVHTSLFQTYLQTDITCFLPEKGDIQHVADAYCHGYHISVKRDATDRRTGANLIEGLRVYQPEAALSHSPISRIVMETVDGEKKYLRSYLTEVDRAFADEVFFVERNKYSNWYAEYCKLYCDMGKFVDQVYVGAVKSVPPLNVVHRMDRQLANGQLERAVYLTPPLCQPVTLPILDTHTGDYDRNLPSEIIYSQILGTCLGVDVSVTSVGTVNHYVFYAPDKPCFLLSQTQADQLLALLVE